MGKNSTLAPSSSLVCWLEIMENYQRNRLSSVQFSHSVVSVCNPMNCSTPGFPVLHQLPELVMTSNHLILCHPLLLLPSFFPNIRVFSSESVLHIRWPKYWSFSFSVNPSKEYSGLISFRIDWFDFLESKGLSRIFSNTTVQMHQFFGAQLSLCNPILTSIHDYWKKNITLTIQTFVIEGKKCTDD